LQLDSHHCIPIFDVSDYSRSTEGISDLPIHHFRALAFFLYITYIVSEKYVCFFSKPVTPLAW